MNSPPGSIVFGTGMDSIFHFVPFHDSENGVPPSMVPTAMHAVDEAHDTAARALYPIREGLGDRWIAHVTPFQRSTSVTVVPVGP